MEKALKIILRISGIITLPAVFAAFFPYDTMNYFHEMIGMGEFPKEPIAHYLAGSLSLFYAMHGAILIFISFNLRKYQNFIIFYCYLVFYLQ